MEGRDGDIMLVHLIGKSLRLIYLISSFPLRRGRQRYLNSSTFLNKVWMWNNMLLNSPNWPNMLLLCFSALGKRWASFFGVSKIAVKECRTSMILKGMDISRLSFYAQNIKRIILRKDLRRHRGKRPVLVTFDIQCLIEMVIVGFYKGFLIKVPPMIKIIYSLPNGYLTINLNKETMVETNLWFLQARSLARVILENV